MNLNNLVQPLNPQALLLWNGNKSTEPPTSLDMFDKDYTLKDVQHFDQCLHMVIPHSIGLNSHSFVILLMLPLILLIFDPLFIHLTYIYWGQLCKNAVLGASCTKAYISVLRDFVANYFYCYT